MPAIVAPISLCVPWAVVPSHFGPVLVGYDYFAAWLFKYPDFGAINDRVLLGFACIVCCALLPPLFAGIDLLRPQRLRARFFFALVMIPGVALFVRLDAVSLSIGWAHPEAFWLALVGPVLRELAAGALLANAIVAESP